MPLQRYEKEQILDACLAVFARYGYEKTSTAMLAEAAGISKALIFHHFGSKEALYFSILERCMEKVMKELRMDEPLEGEDFFTALERMSRVKLAYLKKNPNMYKLLTEAFYGTPDELKAEMVEKITFRIDRRDQVLERLFASVPLKEGVNRRKALELIQVVLKHVENKTLSAMTDQTELDEAFMEGIIDEMNDLLAMIRTGIER
ncbi:TetR/AcrR family transcriptional regulator [Desmospora activa]|uniref:TetR family transcriptional regulator n=1 Tax=Desmospora activa DSM 45169 TaxID=1121389 RepID=A0A2T4Z0S5_9BACL|nr:TetR/AcrR family transcriptional regulator [Desmospora activa]PTM53333.1 TetR family transcriptional regulator [Desmospora activa DSM 45169]